MVFCPTFGAHFTLERGCWEVFFLIENKYFECSVSPLERGLKGCVTVRGAGWVKIILLLFFEVVFLGFGWMLLILGSYART